MTLLLLLLSVLQLYIKIACYCGEPMILQTFFFFLEQRKIDCRVMQGDKWLMP